MLLLYCWGSTSEKGLRLALEQLNIEYCQLTRVMEDYHADAVWAAECMNLTHSMKVDMVFSFDYFPLLSMICEMNHIPYISWIYDCPQYTLYSQTLINDNNYIFCFDKLQTLQMQNMGAKHCVHFPLAFSKHMQYQENAKYLSDISFVGNLYNDAKNRFRKVPWNPYTKGLLDGFIDAQLRIYGYNFIKDVLDEALVESIVEACDLKLGEAYRVNQLWLAADMLNMEVSARERIRILERLGENWDVNLYTTSNLTDKMKQGHLQNCGMADYEIDVPNIYHNSKINLNITSKTIESGIPQRIFDILGCGGFCITNYQPEIAELFEDGRELVLYESVEDLCNKITYYLDSKNEAERKCIALNGQQKVLKEYSLEHRLQDMIGMVGKI